MNDDKEEDIYKVDDDDDEYVEKTSKTEELKAKIIKYGIIAFVCLIIFILLIAILSPKKSNNTSVTTKEVTLNAGDKYSINYSKGTYTWTSSDQSIAKVSDDGEIIALKSGDTTITIKSGSETVSYKVHVDKIDDSVVVTNVKMETNTIELDKDKTYEMKVTFLPTGATNVQLTWISSDENVAIVQDGVIKAKEAGTAMITVMTPNGNTDYCLVKVLGDGKYNPVESISIESIDVSLNKGTSYNLVYEVVPSGSVNLITWESSDEKIATVENGVVYALSSGEVTITAKSGDISKTVNVKVNAEKVTKKVSLDYNSLGLNVGEGFTLTIKDEVPVSWKSSNTNVVVVDQSGNLIAITEGDATITATTDDGSFDECYIVVSKNEANDNISLNTNALSLSVGSVGRLYATVSPSNNVSSVTWSSSDSNVVSVNGGEVRALKVGVAIITAKLPNGKTAECTINVSEKVVNVLQVQINVTDVTLKVGKTTQLSAKVLPSTATNKTITWSSSNTKVATVDKNGKVTAKGKGSAKIYAKASNGVYDVCAVYVK